MTEPLQVGMVDPATVAHVMHDVSLVILQELSDKVRALEERVQALEGA
jgi:hypothetical protein